MAGSKDPNSYTVGWVCALSIEFTAAQVQFETQYKEDELPEHREPNDFNSYSFGKIGKHNVVVAAMPNGQYGTASAATVANNMIRSFPNIRIGLMVGIGGGVPSVKHDIRLGDVVVSSPEAGYGGVFQYDFGKAANGEFQYTASHNKPPPSLLSAVTSLRSQCDLEGLQIHEKVCAIISSKSRLRAKYGRPEYPDTLFDASVEHKSHPCHESCVTTSSDIITRTPREEPTEDVEIHYGTIASGNTLMKDAARRDELASRADILCFEMEAAGLMDGFRCLIIRGICDYCDSHKNDKWQGYAAMTAAVYAKEILKKIVPVAVANEQVLVSKMDQVISVVRNTERAQAKKEVLDWLSDKDFGTYQFDERSKKAPGTCEWFLESPAYHTWTQKKGDVLFCPGHAGAGKTVLASAIIENLNSRFPKESGTAIARVYCNYNRTNEQTFDALRASLLRQLCESLSTLPEGIMKLHSKYESTRFEVPPERIDDGLESVSGQFLKVFMVVDALDEWAPEHGNHYSLPDELLFLQKKLAISLLVTSRPLPLIANHFNHYPSILVTAQQHDIHAYIDNFRWPQSSCISQKPELRGMIKAIIPKVVLGMFLLAKLYLRSLESEISERNVNDALSEFQKRAETYHSEYDFITVKSSKLVDEAYKDTMKRLKKQHETHSDLAFRVLAWICCTSWKLPVDAVRRGLALKEKDKHFNPSGIVDKQLLLSVCCGLVEIPERSGEIRLAHYTTEDFFRRNRPLIDQYFLSRNTPKYGLPSSADAYLVRQCVTCVSIGLPRDRPRGIDLDSYNTDDRFPDPHKLYHDSPKSRVEDYFIQELRSDPLFEYSTFNWVSHLRRLSPSDQTYETYINRLQTGGIIVQAVMFDLTLGDRIQKQALLRHVNSLHLAVLFGVSGLVESLLKNIGIDSKDHWGHTALVLALQCLVSNFKPRPAYRRREALNFDIYDGIDISHRDIVKALLDSGANPHMPGDNGNTPLHLAAILGDIEIVENLLARGANTHSSNKDGCIPLVLAVQHSKESTYMKLLERDPVDIHGENSRTALIEAAYVGNLALVEKLIGKGADVYCTDIKGQTALMKASKEGHTQIVKLLLENQSNVDHQDKKGGTALTKACINDRAGVIKLLVAANARLDMRDHERETALSHAGRHCGEDSIKKLLRRSTDPAIRDQHSGTILISASKWRRPDIVTLILGDTELKPTSQYINHALSEACRDSNEKVVKLLIDHEADPNARVCRYEFNSLLTHAIENSDDAVVQTLLDAGANIEGHDGDTLRPLHMALHSGTEGMARSLIEGGASIDQRSSSGLFPLDFAKRRQDKQISIIQLLQARGATCLRKQAFQRMLKRRAGLNSVDGLDMSICSNISSLIKKVKRE